MSVIELSQDMMAIKLREFLRTRTLTPRTYARYLSMQYHLTKGVQRYFLTAAAHPDMAKRRKLRQFLFEFANEEELHYKIAERDLAHLGLNLSEMPFDVELWHVYFTAITPERPFLRLGAACILENLSAGPVKPILENLLSAPFLGRENTNFIVLHRHEVLPHGDQLLEAISAADLDEVQNNDLVQGARRGAIFYLRMTDWVLEFASEQNELFGSAGVPRRRAA